MKRINNILKNKYFITVIVLFLWILFFDKNDIGTQIEFRKDVQKLQEERNYYAKENAEITKSLKELKTNPKKIEKMAREKYLMKRDNEDIFIIVDENNLAK